MSADGVLYRPLEMKTTLNVKTSLCAVCVDGSMSIWHRFTPFIGNVGGMF
jgi:hypothetical protein